MKICTKLKKLSIDDKEVFERFLGTEDHQLSSYSFTNIFIWRNLYSIEWRLIDERLCVFFTDSVGCFLYLPPLGAGFSDKTAQEVFRTMDSRNKNGKVSRIENVQESELGQYTSAGYSSALKTREYVCRRDAMVALRGNAYKSKRSCANYFTQNFDFEYLPFTAEYTEDCLALYERWKNSRNTPETDRIFSGMLEDSFLSLKALLENYKNLDVKGRVIMIKDRVRAFTFGYELNPKSFCVLFEVTDLSYKGAAQFIFREFCRELDHADINIMDDLGVQNLRNVKLSYRPQKTIPSFCITRT